MTIRKALISDIPEMVNVLKKSMGDFDLQVSENIWNFKHIQNPFGESFVLVAGEDGKIIGIRALMRWQWQIGEQLFFTFRAVDTATDPQHQGKGIFKKLTLSAVDAAKENGEHFIFNTPNDKSRPGYLKMGWEPVGKLSVALQPSYSFLNPRGGNKNYATHEEATELERETLCSTWNQKLRASKALFTPKSSNFLKWRYENNPLQKYEVISTPNYYLAVYVKKRKGLKELRIAECIFMDAESEKTIFKAVEKLAMKFGVHVISYSLQVMKSKSLALKGNFGPILTLRDLNLTAKEKMEFLQVESWCYSLGDLELF